MPDRRLLAVIILVAFVLVLCVGVVGCGKKSGDKAGTPAATQPTPDAMGPPKAAEPPQKKAPPASPGAGK